MGWALAVDIGGTKVAVGGVDGAGRVVVPARVTPTPARDGAALWAALARACAQVREEAAARGLGDPDVCGVGCGGPMDLATGEVSPLNIPGWRRFPLVARLRELLGVPVALDNDAKALALGEGWAGAARGERDYLAMVVSTGVGAGLVVDGRLLDGASGNAGHLGHVVVVPDGRACACGGRGCLEAEASGTSIAAVTGRPAAEAGPDVVARAGRLVGAAVAQAVVLLDLRLALVAGSVALGFGEPFFDAARAELERVARIAYARGARLAPAGLGAGGPLVGAAAVGWRAIGRLGDLG
jgi:glucokinase